MASGVPPMPVPGVLPLAAPDVGRAEAGAGAGAAPPLPALAAARISSIVRGIVRWCALPNAERTPAPMGAMFVV